MNANVERICQQDDKTIPCPPASDEKEKQPSWIEQNWRIVVIVASVVVALLLIAGIVIYRRRASGDEEEEHIVPEELPRRLSERSLSHGWFPE